LLALGTGRKRPGDRGTGNGDEISSAHAAAPPEPTMLFTVEQ
jgi:hypothetical protein